MPCSKTLAAVSGTTSRPSIHKAANEGLRDLWAPAFRLRNKGAFSLLLHIVIIARLHLAIPSLTRYNLKSKMRIPKSIEAVISEFEKLPGIGPKSAERLTYHLLRAPKEYSERLADTISDLKEKTTICETCYNIAESNPCDICQDEKRDKSLIMIVEEPLDVLALEKSRSYEGNYHILGGCIAPLQGIGPDELRIKELLPRLKNGQVKEVILATNPNVEGESTAMYIQKLISPLKIRVTRIARGLPVGADLEYADEVTLSRAIEGRADY